MRHAVELLESLAGTQIKVKEVLERQAWATKWELSEVKAVLRMLQKSAVENKADLARQVRNPGVILSQACGCGVKVEGSIFVVRELS